MWDIDIDTDDDKKISWVNEYRVVWVNSDYEIQEIFVEAESKKKAIIEFFEEVEAIDVENFKIKKVIQEITMENEEHFNLVDFIESVLAVDEADKEIEEDINPLT